MTTKTTENTQETEQEQRALDEIREIAAQNVRRMNPGLVAWLAAKERLFATNVRGDLQNAPERHPDVMLLKRLLAQSSTQLHVRLAWLCWRARQVRFFHPSAGQRTHVGADVLTWAEALESADARDSVHDEAFAARATYYQGRPSRDEQRARAEAEEEAVALTLMGLPAEGHGPATDYVPTDPTSKQEVQETAKAQRLAEEKFDALKAQNRQIETVKPQRRQRKTVKN